MCESKRLNKGRRETGRDREINEINHKRKNRQNRKKKNITPFNWKGNGIKANFTKLQRQTIDQNKNILLQSFSKFV